MNDPRPGLLGPLLRSRREGLVPDRFAVGGGRRRTSGLRRSEVAARANISVEWYIRLEQGRGGRPSKQVLGAVCDALQMGGADREYAFALVRGGTGGERVDISGERLALLQQVVDQVLPWPAYVKSPAWDVLVWNSAVERVLDYGPLLAEEPNILRAIFTHPSARALATDWETHARLTVATFRLELARWEAGDAEVDTLVAELVSVSPDFARMWASYDVRGFGEDLEVSRLSDGTTVQMRYVGSHLELERGASLVMYPPASPDDAALLTALSHTSA